MQAIYLGVSKSESQLIRNRLKIPLYVESVSAGFPSPAQDFVEKSLDLNELFIQHPIATFFVRAEGDSMVDAGIRSGDILIVDRSQTAKHGDIVIASIHGELTVKELQEKPVPALIPHNPHYSIIPITEDSGFQIFGVVTGMGRKFGK